VNVNPVKIDVPQKNFSVSGKHALELKIKIDPKLKAMGTLSRKLNVYLTPKGIKVDLTA